MVVSLGLDVACIFIYYTTGSVIYRLIFSYILQVLVQAGLLLETGAFPQDWRPDRPARLAVAISDVLVSFTTLPSRASPPQADCPTCHAPRDQWNSS